MRNEEQQLLVNELRKTPEFNNIYSEMDIGPVIFQGFNVLNSGAAQNIEILKNIGNSQSSTETFNSSCNAWTFTNEDGIKDDPYNDIQRHLRITCLYDGTLKWKVNGALIIFDTTNGTGQQNVTKVFELDANKNGSFSFSKGNILDIHMFDGSPAEIKFFYKSYKKEAFTEKDNIQNFIIKKDGFIDIFAKKGTSSYQIFYSPPFGAASGGQIELLKQTSLEVRAGDILYINKSSDSQFKINIFSNEPAKTDVSFSYTNQEVQVQPPNKSFTIDKEHAAFKVVNKCTIMITANPFTYVYYNNALTPLRAFNAKENDTFEIWNFDKDWETIAIETENKNYTLKECIEQFHSVPKNSVSPGGSVTLSLNYTLQQANALTILERLIDEAKKINRDIALPLYIDNSIDLNEYKSRFKDQMLDLFLDLQGTNAEEAFSFESGIHVQYTIISSSNDISKIFSGNIHLLEADIFNIGPNCNAEKAFYACGNLEKVTIHKVEGQNNTDFIFGKCTLLVKTLGQDGMIETLKKLGVYDDWYNGVNRSHFFGCPYNGTILSKFASYEKQKENNFNPHWLIPEQLSKEDIREDAGYYNTNGQVKMWPDWKPTYENDDVFPVKIEIGASDGGSTQDTTTSYITIDDKKKYAIGRGHTIAYFKPSDTSNITFIHVDTYDSANSGKLAQELEKIQPGCVVVITSSDATSVSAQDREALKLFGSIRNDTWEPRRFAHMFIGWRGAPSDQVYEYVGTGIESVKKDIVVSVPSNNKNFLFHKTVEYPRAIVPASRVDCWPFVLKNIKSLWESCGFIKTKDKEFDVSFYIQWKGEDIKFSSNFNENLKKSWVTGDPFNIHLRELQPIRVKGNIENLFNGIEWLKTIDINSENIESANKAFNYCSNLKSVKGKINSKDNIGKNANYMFNESFINIENPDLSNFECHFEYTLGCFLKSGITKIDWFSKWEGTRFAGFVFNDCDKIIKIDTKVFPSTIINIFGAFANCKNLEEVQGGWIEPNSSLYYQNYTLSEVTLEQVKDFENPVYKDGFIIPQSVVSAAGLFAGCKKLKSVKDLKLSKGNNSQCFEKCTSLKEVYNVNLNNGTDFKDIFKECPQNKDYRIWLPIIVESTMPYDKNNFLGTGLSIEHVKQFFVDDNFIFVDGKYEPFDAQRRINYENAINPERAFVFKYFTHPHADYHDIWGWNTIHDANVYYDGDVTTKVKV